GRSGCAGGRCVRAEWPPQVVRRQAARERSSGWPLGGRSPAVLGAVLLAEAAHAAASWPTRPAPCERVAPRHSPLAVLENLQRGASGAGGLRSAPGKGPLLYRQTGPPPLWGLRGPVL